MRTMFFVFVSLVSLVFRQPTCLADVAQVDDEADIAEASRFVRQQAQEDLKPSFNSEQILNGLGLTRFYKKGDRWVVAVSHVSRTMFEKSQPRYKSASRFVEPSFYEFHVVG